VTASIQVHLLQQTLELLQDHQCVKIYSISTGENGIGEEVDSGKTPRGRHIIHAKVGDGYEPNTVFIKRQATGEIFTPQMRSEYPDRDWILTRILWLAGVELGKNQGDSVDTLSRYIYIHGSPDDVQLGIPGSKGCIRMHNAAMIELFDSVEMGTAINISED